MRVEILYKDFGDSVASPIKIFLVTFSVLISNLFVRGCTISNGSSIQRRIANLFSGVSKNLGSPSIFGNYPFRRED